VPCLSTVAGNDCLSIFLSCCTIATLVEFACATSNLCRHNPCAENTNAKRLCPEPTKTRKLKMVVLVIGANCKLLSVHSAANNTVNPQHATHAAGLSPSKIVWLEPLSTSIHFLPHLKRVSTMSSSCHDYSTNRSRAAELKIFSKIQ